MAQSKGVTIDPDNRHSGESIKNCLRVATQSEGPVDDDCCWPRERGGECVEAVVEQYGDVSWCCHDSSEESDVPIPVRVLPWGKYFRCGRESQHR
ncbi:unannotated protein [freshwater metagenome]|uniref:Unannotated protein n=1 Tax=freshwater metagenome TaxID=449393 RepID=A0A6J6GFM9_9ZZZZ